MADHRHDRDLANEIGDEYESTTGHPMGSRSPTKPGDEMPVDMPPNTEREQHTRKGQAQSPRELTHNEPEKKRERGR